LLRVDCDWILRDGLAKNRALLVVTSVYFTFLRAPCQRCWQLSNSGQGAQAMKDTNDLSAKQASLTAGIIGAVMVVLVCFAAAFVFSNPVGAQTGTQLQTASEEANQK